MADSDRLTPAQQRAIAALLSCRNLREASKECKIAERTLHRWTTQPNFAAALRKAEQASITAVVRRLSGAADSAVGVTLVIMLDSKTPASVRLQAANLVLGKLIDLRQFATLEERLTAIEARLEMTDHEH